MSSNASHGTGPLTVDELRELGIVADLPTACRALGIAYNTGLGLVHAGRFPCRVIVLDQRRNRYRVPVDGLLALLGFEA